MRRGTDVVACTGCVRFSLGDVESVDEGGQQRVAAQDGGGANAAAPSLPAAAAAAGGSSAEAAAAGGSAWVPAVVPDGSMEMVVATGGGAWLPAIGTRCEARYQASHMPLWQAGKWYAGVIYGVDDAGRMDIAYDDGDTEMGVLPQYVRLERARPAANPPAAAAATGPAAAAAAAAAAAPAAPSP